MKTLRHLTAIALVTLSGIAAAGPQVSHAAPATLHQRIELRHDTRTVAQQRHDLQQAQQALYRAERSHDIRRVREARRDVERERRELQQARMALRHDRSHLHR